LWLSNLLEAFPGRLLTEVIDEMHRLEGPQYPAGLLGDVLEAGAYKQARAMTEAAKTAEARKALPRTELFGLVQELRFELAHGDTEGPEDE